MESWLFLLLVLLVGIISKNQSIMISTVVVMILKLFPFTKKIMSELRLNGISWGVLVITIAILVPIATGEIGFSDLLKAFRTPVGWVAIVSGILVSILSDKGKNLLSEKPEVTVALTFGTIIGVVFFRGLAAGPVIAGGITYCIVQIIFFFFK